MIFSAAASLKSTVSPIPAAVASDALIDFVTASVAEAMEVVAFAASIAAPNCVIKLAICCAEACTASAVTFAWEPAPDSAITLNGS